MKLFGNWKLEIRNSRQWRAGMTFIELIVVIGIFATISGVVLFNFTGFTTNISLQNLANQIALQLKKAQTQSLSGAGGTILFGPNKPSYGVHFNTSTPSEFIYFADLDNDGEYDSGICNNPYQGLSECVDKITIQTGDRISLLSTSDCPASLSVAFKRPFPDATFFTSALEPVQYAEIEITSPKAIQKTIRVWPTGQIEIKNQKITNNSCA